jgi:hypothetical protein
LIKTVLPEEPLPIQDKEGTVLSMCGSAQNCTLGVFRLTNVTR